MPDSRDEGEGSPVHKRRQIDYPRDVENDSEVQVRWIGADSILFATAHRPWPLPERQWAMTQTWHDLLFAHFQVEPAALRKLVPGVLGLDLYGDQAWLSITPFWIGSLRPPGIPPIPKLSRFYELNVRTYVTYRDKPGVYFFSLDASNLSAVWGARMFYRLPYWHARMSSQGTREIRYEARRLHGPSAVGGMPRIPRRLPAGLATTRGTRRKRGRVSHRALLSLFLEPQQALSRRYSSLAMALAGSCGSSRTQYDGRAVGLAVAAASPSGALLTLAESAGVGAREAEVSGSRLEQCLMYPVLAPLGGTPGSFTGYTFRESGLASHLAQ